MKDINSNIEILSTYINDKTKVNCRCKVCGFEWEATPSNLLQGKGCKQCHFNNLSKMNTKSHEQFVEDVYRINKNIKVISRYTGVKNKVKCLCLLHNTVFIISPTHLLGGETGCKECIDIKRHLSGLKSHEQFIKDLRLVNQNIKVIGEYNGAKNKIKVKCEKCGYLWEPFAGSLLSGYGCPNCIKSKGEEKIKQYLDENQILYENPKKFPDLRNKLPLSYDFYLPEYNLLIEYQGQFHDGTAFVASKDKYFERQKTNDKIKKNYAFDNNYNFLEIWYYDYKKVEEIIDETICNLKNPVTTIVL